VIVELLFKMAEDELRQKEQAAAELALKAPAPSRAFSAAYTVDPFRRIGAKHAGADPNEILNVPLGRAKTAPPLKWIPRESELFDHSPAD
jgi:hypothetical protein